MHRAQCAIRSGEFPASLKRSLEELCTLVGHRDSVLEADQRDDVGFGVGSFR